MSLAPTPLEADLVTFSARVLRVEGISAAAMQAGMSEQAARHRVETYASEAIIGLRLVAPLLVPGLRVLEIGCGLGLLSAFLGERKFDITAIEPGSAGFDLMTAMADVLRNDDAGKPRFRLLKIGVTDLDPKRHGRFDLIFSCNVLEHVPPLDLAFRYMKSVLAPGGQMVHLTPNYVVPYEPHFNIPLVPFWPGMTRHFAKSRIAKLPGVWEDLNFITSWRVTRLAHRHGLDIAFDRGVLGSYARRFTSDAVYSQRQRGMAATLGRLLTASGGLKLLDAAPGALLTPMVFRLTHARR